MTFERILHPTDFDSQVAFEHALRLALAARCELDIVHVEADAGRAGHEWDAFPGVRATLARWGLLDADAPASAVADALGVQVVKRDVPSGGAVETLTALSSRGDVDLLVFGTGARGRFGQLWRPSVSEAVTRQARVPALFIPQQSTGFLTADGMPRLRTVVLPVGGGVAPDVALELVSRLAAMLGEAPVLHRLHVGESLASEVDLRFQEHAVRSGLLAETIAAYAAEVSADLVVMSTSGHDSWRDTAFGSLTEQVLRLSSKALLAVPV